MSISWWRRWLQAVAPVSFLGRRTLGKFRPGFESLEDRAVPSATLVRDIAPGVNPSYPASLVSSNGALFFTAAGPSSGQELWKSDGTAAGTTLVKDLLPGPYGSFPQNLTNVNGT